MYAGPSPLKPADFRAIRDRLYQVSGIDLQAGKEGLVQTRLAKRLRELRIASYKEYLDVVDGDRTGKEFSHMVDLLTTNKTSFFREAHHFDLMRDEVLPELFRTGGPIRIWSAGCSSGEEPYTLGQVVQQVEAGTPRDVRILATDLSTRVLARASSAIYEEAMLEDVTPDVRKVMFEAVTEQPGHFKVQHGIRSRIRFARLNLMDDWPMKGPFQIIFCRNVMIYFDRPTQERLIARFHGLLAPGGYLFVGHSESLTGLEHQFSYVAPAVYVK